MNIIILTALTIIWCCLMFDAVYFYIMMRRYEKKGDELRKQLQKMIDNRKEYDA